MDFGLTEKLAVVLGSTKGIAARTVAMLLVSMATFATAQHTYADEHDFGDIATAALMVVAETHGIELSLDDAQAAIVDPLRSLPPHSDVVAGLRPQRHRAAHQEH